MACTVVYKGKTYTEPDFIQYIKANPTEFQELLPSDLNRDLNSNKFSRPLTGMPTAPASIMAGVASRISTQLSPEVQREISDKYGVMPGTNEFTEALTIEVTDSLVNKLDNETNRLATEELIGAIAQLPSDQVMALDGLERKLYNLVTEQRTEFQAYPQLPDTEIAFPAPEGWQTFNKQELMAQAKNGEIDIDTMPGLATFLAVEMMYEDKANTAATPVDFSKVMSEKTKSETTKKLFSVLERLGFSTVKLSDYIQAHKLRTGVDPSVNALADMVKRVVALSEDANLDEVMAEEVAHVLTETYNNQDEIRAILPEVESTDVWKDHAATYFSLYESKGLTGEQLTEKVRREILGKLIAEKFAEIKEAEPTTFLGRVGSIVQRFFTGIKSRLKPSIKTNLTNLIDKIAENALEEEKLSSMFSAENLDGNPFGEFYSAEESILTAQLSNMLRNSRKLLNKNRGGNLSTKVETMASLIAPGNLSSIQINRATAQYLDITNSIKKDVQTKVRKYEEAVRNGQTPKTFLSSMENASINILITENLPHLQMLAASLPALEAPTYSTPVEEKAFRKYKNKILTQVDSLIKDINTLKGEVILKNTISGQALLDDMINEYNLSEAASLEIRNYLKTTHADITSLHAFFGNLQNAPNPILALFSRLIGDIHHKTDMATQSYRNNFIALTNKLGIPQSSLQGFFEKIIQKTPEGKITGFLQGVVDWGKFDAERKAVEIQAYNMANERFLQEYNIKHGTSLNFEPITSIDEIGEKPNLPRISEFTGKIREDYNNTINVWRDENLEQPYNVSFRQDRQNMLNDIRTNGITLPDGRVVRHVPPIVEQMMAGWAKERRNIKAPYIKNGVLDYAALSEVERGSLDEIKRDRLDAKSLVDSITGELKSGEELDIALALQAIEQYYVQKNTDPNQKRSIKQEFLNVLNSFSNNSDSYNWFSRNSGFTFNDNFWKKLDSNSVSTADKFRAALSQVNLAPTEELEMKDRILELETLLKKRTQFLKQFKNPLSPAEVDTSLMSSGAQGVYLTMEADIETLFSLLNTLPKEKSGDIATDIQTESTANDSFDRDFAAAKQEDPSLTLLSFAKSHMTQTNSNSAFTFSETLRSFERSGILLSNSNLEIKRSLGLPTTASSAEIKSALSAYLQREGSFESLTDAFTKSRLAGYYKRYAPKGFTDFNNMVKSGNIVDENGNSHTFAEIVTAISENNTSGMRFKNDILDYLSLNPEVEWMEDENQLSKNPNFIENSDTSTFYGGYGQPRLDKYTNTDFVNKYNIDMNLYTSTGETKSHTASSEQQKELSMLEFLVHSRYNNFKDQGVDNNANAYSLPGVRMASVDKMKAFTKNPINGVREWYQDQVQNSVDKKIFGENISGELDNDTKNIDNLVIPVLNVQPLERLEDTSLDLLYSYTVHNYNANLYKNRQEAFTKANQLETLLLSRDFKDKAAKDSNAHKTFQDFKKAYLLGVQETQRIKVGIGGRQVDLTNILRTFDRALGTVNVGLNPAVSITAASSALTFSTTEALVGQYINAKSYTKGLARFHSKAGSFLSETGDLNKTNEIYLFGEKFGLYGILNGAENSGEANFTRALMKDGLTGVAHVMTDILTKPFAPSTMYAVLDDHRMVKLQDPNGNETYEVMTFNKFKEIHKKAKLTKTEINDKWRTFEESSVLNNLTTTGTEVGYSQKFNDIFEKMYTTPEDIAKAKNTLELDIRNMTSTVISRIDAKMPLYDKSVASRNAMARFLLRHREWFTINFQNRFKRQHENLYTGQLEEGSYHTLGRFMLANFKAFNPRNDENMRDVFENLTDAEKMNLKRVMIDTAISVVLSAIGMLVIRPWGDDEENKDNWKVQFLSYMYYRLSSEQMTSGLLGIPSYKDVLESPIVAINSVKEVLKPSNWSAKPVESGPYEGHSKLFKLVAKNTFARHYYDLVHGLQKKSDFYRLNNEWTLLMMQKISKKEREAQEKYEEELRESYVPRSEKFVR